MKPKSYLSAAAASGAIAKGRLSAVDYISGFIDCIKKHNPTVCALSDWSESKVLEQSLAIDSGFKTGALLGVPIAVKDNIDVSGLPTGFGADKSFHEHPSTDANCVGLLKDAGAIIVGKAETAEFAFLTPPPTRNPHNLAHTPGGSSSGSAAGVAAGMFPLALGTQTGGSTIRPASFCGVFGFKPTFGLVSRAGIKPFSESFDTVGWFGRHIEDIALLFSVLAPCSHDIEGINERGTPSASLRLAFCPTPYWSKVEPALQNKIKNVARNLDATQIELPFDMHQVSADLMYLISIEMSRSLRVAYRLNADALSSSLRKLIKDNLCVDYKKELQARVRLERSRQQLDVLFEKYDALITPATTGAAPPTLEHTGDYVFNVAWTALHVPCLSIPIGKNDANMPLGLQLVGPRYGDKRFLSLAHSVCTHLNI